VAAAGQSRVGCLGELDVPGQMEQVRRTKLQRRSQVARVVGGKRPIKYSREGRLMDAGTGTGNCTLQDTEARQDPCRPHKSIHGASSPSSFLGITLRPPSGVRIGGCKDQSQRRWGAQSVDARASGVSVLLRVSSCSSLGGSRGGAKIGLKGVEPVGPANRGGGEPCTNSCHTAKILAVSFWRALKALWSTWLVEWRGPDRRRAGPSGTGTQCRRGRMWAIGEDAQDTTLQPRLAAGADVTVPPGARGIFLGTQRPGRLL
jgi:hypothetical protein